MFKDDKGCSLMAVADAIWPDAELQSMMDIADKMNLSERLVDMEQVMEITTLSRGTLLNLEKRGEFPERVQVTEGRKAWYLSEVVTWINNIPCRTNACLVPIPKKPSEALRLKISRARKNAQEKPNKYVG